MWWRITEPQTRKRGIWQQMLPLLVLNKHKTLLTTSAKFSSISHFSQHQTIYQTHYLSFLRHNFCAHCRYDTMTLFAFKKTHPSHTKTRDIHIECSKQFKWNLYLYVSGQCENCFKIQIWNLNRLTHIQFNVWGRV